MISASYNCGTKEVLARGTIDILMASVLGYPSLCFNIGMVIFWVSSVIPSSKGMPIKIVRMSRNGRLLNRNILGWLDLAITYPLLDMSSAAN